MDCGAFAVPLPSIRIDMKLPAQGHPLREEGDGALLDTIGADSEMRNDVLELTSLAASVEPSMLADSEVPSSSSAETLSAEPVSHSEWKSMKGFVTDDMVKALFG